MVGCRSRPKTSFYAIVYKTYAFAYAKQFKGIAISTERHIRLFRNGRNQAVRIPREFELDADEVVMRREDHRIVIEPIRRRGLLAPLATLLVLDETLPDVDHDLQTLDEIDL